MPFKKGDKKPTSSGRKKNTPNRSTEQMKKLIQYVIDNKLDMLSDDLDSMKPSMRWTIADKMMKYFMPSLTENENNNTGDVSINITYNKREIEDEDDDFDDNYKNDSDED